MLIYIVDIYPNFSRVSERRRKIAMRRIKREDEEGAMGVGTLIIFIAMVLVAAVAAGVLIQTANQLQQQAQRTGDEAIMEVSSSFTVQDAYGVAELEPDDEIEEINLKIGLAAGAEAQDLNNTIIQVQNETEEVNLQATEDDDPTDGAGDDHYGYEDLKIDDGSESNSFVGSGDLYKITIDINAAFAAEGDGGGLGTQERVHINIIPKHGTPTYEEVNTPATIRTDIVDL